MNFIRGKKVVLHLLLGLFSLTTIFFASCQSLDGIYERLNQVEADVSDLKSVVAVLKDAYSSKKNIESVTPLTDVETGGWLISFSDETYIRVVNPSVENCLIESIIQDDKSHAITMTLADGSIFTFNKFYVLPASISLLTISPVVLSAGSQACVEFRVNPSNAFFSLNNYENEECPIELDRVSFTPVRSFSITKPSNYKLVRVEHVYDENTGGLKEGQYRAIIEDTNKSAEYEELVTLVLNAEDTNGDKIQISSDAFVIRCQSIANLVHNGLPVVLINTPNFEPILSKDDYILGSYITLLNEDMSYGFQGEMKIKGRGNSTWSAPKKPYKIKFDKKQSLFGEPKDKEWVLLANYYDKSLIRTEVAYWMATEFGLFDYVPKFHFVDLLLNGNYNGTYQLGDQIKISENRVNVGDDGFLMEIDAKADPEDVTFKVAHISQPINIKDPDVVIGDDNYRFVVDYVKRADEALYSTNWLDSDEGYKSLIDMDSFVEWYLIMEITKNNDAIFYSSCYMNLSRSGKLKMGPLWDFDISMGGYPWGREFVNNPENFYIKGNTSWINRMFLDPDFVSNVKTRFDVYYNNKNNIIEHIENVANANKLSAFANNRLWGTLCVKNCTEKEFEDNYDSQIKYIENWLLARFEWLKVAFDAM